MVDDQLCTLVLEFLDNNYRARKLSFAFSQDSRSAWGCLWQRLRPCFDARVRNPVAWVSYYGLLHLREFLRRECEPLHGDGRPNERGSYQAVDSLERHEVVEAVRANLNTLPPNHREAVLASAKVHPEGLSERAVARRYGKSHEAARKWAAMGTQRLTYQLEAFK